jgi:phosphotransferase system  glucose/maltose/N-acetylglucosamine-specific IIC component
MKMLKKLFVVAAGVAASSGAFAQASGVDVTSTVTSISGVTTSIEAIGGAVLAVVVVAWGYRVVKGFIGR